MKCSITNCDNEVEQKGLVCPDCASEIQAMTKKETLAELRARSAEITGKL